MDESFADESLTRETVAAVVDGVAADLLAAAGVSGPPVDALTLARTHLGLEIATADRSRSRVEERRLLIPADDRPEQTQWAVAAALGSRFKPDVLRRLGIPDEAQRGLAGVSIANLFAARLLLPTPWFAEAARDTGYDLLDLQRRFSTAGIATVAARLLDLPEPCAMTQVDAGSVVWRRSNAYRLGKKLSWPEQRCRELVLKHGEPYVFRARGWTVQGWPIPMPIGTREFLRSVIDEDAAAGE